MKGKKRNRYIGILTPLMSISFFAALLLLFSYPAYADFTGCAIDWNSFNNPGFVAEYTYQGQIIRDHESTGSGDPSRGSANVPPDATDLASSADAANNPGTSTTPFFGYYNGGTPYDPADPATMEDDYIFFRMRLRGDPSDNGTAFKSYHWNILLDVDADGYKEYWIDLEGSCQNKDCPGGSYDRLNILYDNNNQQDIADADAARVDFFQAQNSEDYNAGCVSADPNSPGLSHTRVLSTTDGSGDYWLEIQVPMTAFNDANGNQVLFPDSPVGFVFSTGASNQDPLQKDHMMDLNFISNADPITFGDIVYPNGKPITEFTDSSLNLVSFYSIGDNIFVWVTDPAANTNECSITTTTTCSIDSDCPGGETCVRDIDTISVTVTNPTTGDDEVIALEETDVTTGIFTNPSGCSLCDALLTSDTLGGSDNDGILLVSSGDTIYVSYTNPNSITTTDEAGIVGQCEAFIQFTRANGLPSDNFQLTNDRATSDKLYVTVNHSEANTDPGSQQTISVTLTGPIGDQETLTLTETGNDTGEFRNTTGLDTEVAAAPITQGDNLWEDNDGGVVTATYSYTCLGTPYTETATADLFYTTFAGRAYFRNGSDTSDIDLYTANEPVFLKVEDGNACTTTVNGIETVTVTVTSDTGDSETVTLYETFAGSAVFMNRTNDLVTSAGSALVTSASSTFLTDGVQPGDTFIIATGPDAGTYTVATVDSETQITLASTLSTSRTDIGFNAQPLLTATYDGSYSANDNILEASNSDTLTVSYTDCDDGDSDPGNDAKTDTATYNVPDLVINEVLFYPGSTSCQTEYIELYNSSSQSVNATGFRLTDEDGSFNYTIPQMSGTDITLLAGEKIIISVYESSTSPSDYYDSGAGIYYLFDTSSSTYPSNFFGDPGDADPADQLSLYDTFNTIVDYVGWSSTLSPSVDFLGDDSPAVARSIWQDDSFKNVSGMSIGYPLGRSPEGYDTNNPSDWNLASSASTVCNDIVITRASISSFQAFPHNGQVVVEWETASEVGTVGFHLYRFSEIAHKYKRVNDMLLPGLITAPQGGTYRLIDPGASVNGSNTYMLVEVEANSKERSYGPYTINKEGTVVIPRKTVKPMSHKTSSKTDSFPEVYQYIDEEGTIVITDRKSAIKKLRIKHVVEAFTVQEPESIPKTVKISDSSFNRVEAPDDASAEPGEITGIRTEPSESIVMTKKPVENSEKPVLTPSLLHYSRKAHAITEKKKERREARKKAREFKKARRKHLQGKQLKMAINEDGVYFIGKREIASLLGVSSQEIKKLIQHNAFSLSNKGQNIASLPAENYSGIYFYGQGIDSIYTNENIYWLKLDRGRQMETIEGNGPVPVLDKTRFRDSIHYEEDNFPATSLFTDPNSDYWFWDYIMSGQSGMDKKTFALQANGISSTSEMATLTVKLQGLTDTPVHLDHHAVVALNGTIIGESRWEGKESHTITLSFSQQLLNEGENIVKVTGKLDSGVPYSIFYVDSFELTYQRLYQAAGNKLLFPGDSNQVLTITGFSHPDIFLFDITHPQKPKAITATTIDAFDGTYSISFTPNSSDSRYFALASTEVASGVNIWADTTSRLRKKNNKADYMIIVPSEFKESAQRLAQDRQSKGLMAKVVDLEDIMDEFNYGISNPEALRSFLTYTYRNWRNAPRYVVLAGEGTFDYKDVFGNGENLISPVMVGTPDGLFPSDNYLADADGDYIPEIAIGRLPVVTEEELNSVVNKIIAYESSYNIKKKVLMLSDDPVEDGNFPTDSDTVAALLPQDFTIEKIYLSEHSVSVARQLAVNSINNGSEFVNYIGHGGLDRIADEGLLRSSDVDSLTNSQRLPIITAMTCMVGYFAMPGYDSFSEVVILKNNSGAVAVWSPSGLSIHSKAMILNREFYKTVTHDRFGKKLLGDVILKALEEYGKTGSEMYLLDIYTLLGDPALRLR